MTSYRKYAYRVMIRLTSCTTMIYNYGLHEKLISIIIKLRKGYKITLSRFNNNGY
jgi:hypothetical protein